MEIDETVSLATPGVFCEVFGITTDNRILEYLLEAAELGISIGDMARDLEISRPKAYQAIYELEEKRYVKKHRVISKTQLYILNKENPHVKVLLRAFNDCLNMVMDEYIKKEKTKPMVMVK
ncbi:MAG TPA: winged helix-turn-helix domain-containing protein [Candidatus Nanoarchaeia archaeon]|nr:winged helix-turn-helix domain-containing protein [Candidatus Nanoarchaeia archaeon]